jgi:hypothetical protein
MSANDSPTRLCGLESSFAAAAPLAGLWLYLLLQRADDMPGDALDGLAANASLTPFPARVAASFDLRGTIAGGLVVMAAGQTMLSTASGVRQVDIIARSALRPGVSAKGHVRGSASARLGQVQGGSRRMWPPKFLPTGDGGGVYVLPRFRPSRSLFDTHCR